MPQAISIAGAMAIFGCGIESETCLKTIEAARSGDYKSSVTAEAPLRLLKWTLLLSSAVTLSASPAASSPPLCIQEASEACQTEDFPTALSPAPLTVFDATTKIVSKCFYDQTFHGLNWPREVGKARAALGPSSSDTDVEITLNALLAELHASHTEYVSVDDQEYWALESIFSGEIDGAPFPQIGAVFQQVNGRWFVRDALEGSAAERAGLRRGDEIVQANGKPLAPVRSFADSAPGGCVSLGVRAQRNGPVRTICVEPRKESIPRSLLTASRDSMRVLNIRGKRIGYFHLWSGTHDEFKNLLAEVAAFMEGRADALIFDIRDGYGGASADFLDPFLKTGAFTKPLYLLINGGVRSGKETLAYLLKTTGRAVLIGTRTAGHYLAGRLIEIVPGKTALYLAVCGDSQVGVPLEGIGVAPDIEVSRPLTYSHGTDPQLQYALSIAAERASEQGSLWDRTCSSPR